MIFIGDIASPDILTNEQLQSVFNENSGIFNGKRLICNFEGLISKRMFLNKNRPILFNHPLVPGILNRGITPVLCLANNHTLDLPSEFDTTTNIFKQEQISFCGAGKSRNAALSPISFNENNQQIILFNACWDFLLYNHRNPSKGLYVAEINEPRLIQEVRQEKEKNRHSIIIIYLHWSLDLEILPFPMYRQFSMALIDAGANIVVGSHSHCVQGGEKYKDGFIVYGLGNFFMPHNTFFMGKLKYPEFANIQLALEWDPSTNIAICHWFEYQNIGDLHTLKNLGSEYFEKSERLKKYFPCQGKSHVEYLTYFKKHRRKRFLIPLYSDYRSKYKNMLFTHLLKNRAYVAHTLARINIIKWQK